MRALVGIDHAKGRVHACGNRLESLKFYPRR